MAIQISGTTVINNSRQLQNIASVDATTAAVISANAASGPKFQEAITSSGTFTPKMNGTAYLILVGAGGSGGIGRDVLLNTSSYYNVAGGGAGGMCIHKATLSTSQSYSLTIGAGHTNTNTYGSNASNGISGSSGGASSFSGNGISLTANGGGGGQATPWGRQDTNVAGGSGGTASGANVYNITGGRGSNCVRSQMGGNQYVGGGGSCGGSQSVWYSAFNNGEALPNWLSLNSFEDNSIPASISNTFSYTVTAGGNAVWRGGSAGSSVGNANAVGYFPGGGAGGASSRQNNGSGRVVTSTSASGALNVLYFG